jgi:hypothetical protein
MAFLDFSFTFSSLIIFFGLFSRRKTTALSTIEYDGTLFSLPTVVWFSDREIVKKYQENKSV